MGKLLYLIQNLLTHVDSFYVMNVSCSLNIKISDSLLKQFKQLEESVTVSGVSCPVFKRQEQSLKGPGGGIS